MDDIDYRKIEIRRVLIGQELPVTLFLCTSAEAAAEVLLILARHAPDDLIEYRITILPKGV